MSTTLYGIPSKDGYGPSVGEVDTSTEIWADVPGFKGLYTVSTEARVMTNYWRIERFITPSWHKHYMRVTMRKETKSYQVGLARLVLSTWHKPPRYYAQPQVEHINGDLTDCRLINLTWKDSPFCKIDGIIAADIRRRFNSRINTVAQLADLYSLSKEAILEVLKRHTWNV